MKASENEVVSLIKTVNIDVAGDAWGDRRRARALLPRSTRSPCRDVMKYAQNWVGSLSLSSRDSQVTQRGLTGIYSLSKVVFPKPAGAAIRVSFRPNPEFKRSVRRGRDTSSARWRGMKSFVRRSSVISPSWSGCRFYPYCHTTKVTELIMGKHFDRA